MKSTRIGRIGRMALVMLVVTLVSVMTALAVPPSAPKEFEARLAFVAGSDPLDVRNYWELSNPVGCTTESTTGSLRNFPGDQSWVLVPRKDDFRWYMSPVGTGSFDVWIEINQYNRLRFAGTFHYVKQGGNLVCTGTARIVQTYGPAVTGWTMDGSMRAVSQTFDWAFSPSPTVVGFPQDTKQFSDRGPYGFWISGTLVKGGGAGGGGGEKTSSLMMTTANQEMATIIDTGLETLEEAGTEVTDEQIEATLAELEKVVGIRPRRGGR